MPPSALEGRVRQALSPRFAIERELGRGGMATVFLAHDSVQDRKVAIKVLDLDVTTPHAAERFLREIRLLATLQHPHILPLHDSGLLGDTPYYVMPYVAGDSLRDRLKREGNLPLDFALRICSEMCAALDYAHRQGVIHRDIKPENVLLSDDHVLLADFGIARAAAQSADQRLTATSVVIGTPAYMSPEQATGDQLDSRSDIYSLACVVFEMISGQCPFSGRTPMEIVSSRFRNDVPKISSLQPGVPRSVERALSSALSIAPDDRPPTAGDFAAMLSADGQERLQSPIMRNKAIILGAIAVVAIAGGMLAARYGVTGGANKRESAGVERPLVHRTTNDMKAHDLYLQGSALQSRQDTASWRKAIALFSDAIARDSLYAAPWAGISQVYASFGIGNQAAVQPRPAFEQARIAAERALALDSTSVEALAAMSVVQMMYDYDWNGATASLSRAHDLDPAYERTYLYRSFLLTWLGKFREATSVASEGLRLSPADLILRREVNRTLLLDGKTREAEQRIRETLAMDSTNARTRMLLGQTLIVEGKTRDAVRELQRSQQILPTTRGAAFLVAAYFGAGRKEDARRLVDSLVAVSDRTFVPAMDIAIAYAGLRDTATTLQWLERAYDDRTLRPYLRDQVFAFVRAEPRYRALVAKMKLPKVDCC